MKLNKIMMAAVIAFGASSFAQAADQGHGKVTFTGSIIESYGHLWCMGNWGRWRILLIDFVQDFNNRER